jgi:glycerol-1-phosphatase
MGWQRTFNLPLPGSERLITAESVHIGKPDPTCYYLGRKRLGLSCDTSEVLVIEDSPAGIRAGQEANCRVLGLLTSHTYEQIATSGPDWIVQDLESVKVLRTDGGKVIIEICNII